MVRSRFQRLLFNIVKMKSHAETLRLGGMKKFHHRGTETRRSEKQETEIFPLLLKRQGCGVKGFSAPLRLGGSLDLFGARSAPRDRIMENTRKLHKSTKVDKKCRQNVDFCRHRVFKKCA